MNRANEVISKENKRMTELGMRASSWRNSIILYSTIFVWNSSCVTLFSSVIISYYSLKWPILSYHNPCKLPLMGLEELTLLFYSLTNVLKPVLFNNIPSGEFLCKRLGKFHFLVHLSHHMPPYYVLNIRGSERYIRFPWSKSSVRVDCIDPLL